MFAYFDRRVKNDYPELLNNLIRVVNRIGHSYSIEVLRAKILFTKRLQTGNPVTDSSDEPVLHGESGPSKLGMTCASCTSQSIALIR